MTSVFVLIAIVIIRPLVIGSSTTPATITDVVITSVSIACGICMYELTGWVAY